MKQAPVLTERDVKRVLQHCAHSAVQGGELDAVLAETQRGASKLSKASKAA